MNMILRNNGRASSMPAGFAWGGVVSLAMTLLLSTVLAWLIISEKMMQSQIGYAVMVILTVSSFLGAKAAVGKIRRRILLVCICLLPFLLKYLKMESRNTFIAVKWN